MKFRKKPIVIDAVLWTGNNFDEIMAFFQTGAPLPMLMTLPEDAVETRGIGFSKVRGEPMLQYLHIPTLEGTITAQPGDWIVKGVHGEFYSCKPDIFMETNEPVDTECTPQMTVYILFTSNPEHAPTPVVFGVYSSLSTAELVRVTEWKRDPELHAWIQMLEVDE